MNFEVIDPLQDRRWDALASTHSDASVFHQRGWIEALYRTYDYKPFVLTSARAGEPLTDGVAMCRVSSWITGTRLVSLPFADHCEPLLRSSADSAEFGQYLRQVCVSEEGKYIELRPMIANENAGCGLQPERSFCFHELDLSPSKESLFARLHKNSFQRKIRRASREGLTYEAGRSPRLVNEFYRLVVNTRRRHKLLPQPRNWFSNLVECMGDKAEIRVARKDGQAIAAMLCLRHRGTTVYKYGCSDAKFHNLGAMPFLFWQLIEESKAAGVEVLDLGRSDFDNPGLVTFKDRLGANRRLMTYFRYTHAKETKSVIMSNFQANQEFLLRMPDTVLATAGWVMYRHMG